MIAYEEKKTTASHECMSLGDLTSLDALGFSDNRYGSSELSDAIKALATVGSPG